MKRAFLASLLCVCVFFSGSVKPFFVYASIDDEWDDGEDTEFVEDDIETDESDAVEDKYRDRLAELSDQLKEIEKKSKEIQENINGAKDEKEKKQREKAAIDQQISMTQSTIATLMARIDLLENDIVDKENEIADKQNDIKSKQSEIDDNYEILRKRLRAKYMQDTSTTLGLIVGSDSFSDLLTRVEYVRRIAEHDRALLEELTVQREEMETEKKTLELKLADLEAVREVVQADRAETESQKKKLDGQSWAAQQQVEDLAEMERLYLADLEKNKKIQQAAMAEIDRIYKEIEWSKNPYAGGVMTWPLPDYIPGRNLSITSRFGLRFGGSDNHTGVDLSGSGIFGHNIVAANSGTVVVAQNNYAQGVGYGRYVMIDHGVDDQGRSVSTLYGHCSSLSVSVGQQIQPGQVIAQVGSTGWSSGPHLHFEVRLDGKPVNPEPYIFS